MYKKWLGLMLLVLSAGVYTSSASAASACKGLSKARCDSSSKCYWVKSYTTKKGTSVSAHCRAKPGAGSSKSKSDKKKTSSSGSNKKSSGSSSNLGKKKSSSSGSDKKKKSSKSDKKKTGSSSSSSKKKASK